MPRKPEAGVLFAGDSELLAQAGLTKGDIVVAFNGRRVYDTTQYTYIRSYAARPQMDLIVCRDGELLEIHASPPNGKFGVPLADYHKPR